jgi:hypothetical protein
VPVDVGDQVANLLDGRNTSMPGVGEQRDRAVPPGGAPHRSAVRPESADPDRGTGALDRGGQQGDVGLSADEHRRMFMTFLAGLIRYFDRYVERGDIDLIRDGISYRLTGMWLSKAEAKKVAHDLNNLLRPAAGNLPKRGRKRWYFGSIVLPAPEPPSDA